jgi:hypothetical protein
MLGLTGAAAVSVLIAGIRDGLQNPKSRQRKGEQETARMMQRRVFEYGVGDLQPKDYGDGLDLRLDAPAFAPKDSHSDEAKFRVPGPPGIRADIFSVVFSVLRIDGVAYVGACHYRYLPCACRVCCGARTAAAYEQCEHAPITRARGSPLDDQPDGQDKVMCPFRIRPIEVIGREERKRRKAAGEDVWRRFFDGVQERTETEREEDAPCSERAWRDFLDDSTVRQLQRAHAVAGRLDEGEYFAVMMAGLGGGAGYQLENTGWCVYQVSETMHELSGDVPLHNRAARTEHRLLEGEQVVSGTPLVCTEVTEQGERVYQLESAVGAEGADAGEQTFSTHLIICQLELEQVNRSTGGARQSKRARRGALSSRLGSLYRLSPQQVQLATEARRAMREKNWGQAQRLAIEGMDAPSQ